MSSKRAMRRRMCGAKDRFPSEEAALAAIRRLRRATGTHDWLTPYRCRFCGGFHFGHPPRRVRQAQVARAGAARR
jgi:hypothetical protein